MILRKLFVPAVLVLLASSMLSSVYARVMVGRVMLTDSTANADIKAIYPKTNNAVVDKDLDSLVHKMVLQFKKDVGDEPLMGRVRYSLDLDFISSQLSPDIRSYELDRIDYTGGAHDQQDIITRTYDLATGRLIRLADLFRPGVAYLDTLSRLARLELQRRLGKIQFPKGLEPTLSNFSRFTLNEREIILHFPPYQVASYADRTQEVRIYYGQLKSIFRPEFLEGQ